MDGTVSYSFFNRGKEIIARSFISMKTDKVEFGAGATLLKREERLINEELKPAVRQKYSVINDICSELELFFEGNYSILFRVYNDGCAYRFKSFLDEKITILAERAEFNFTGNYKIYFHEEKSFYSHSEQEYQYINLSDISAGRFCSLPALVDFENGTKAAITESDLEDYPGMYLTPQPAKKYSLEGIFPKYPATDSVKSDRDLIVTRRENFLALTNGSRSFPWRVIIVTEKDGDLIESAMIYKLAKPQPSGIDFSWVAPGKVAWDWWNANNIYGVDFRAGINTTTYKYYIDFASQFGIEYIILDEGWYKLGDLFSVNPEINIEELVEYGRAKNVGVILWMSWLTLNNQLDRAMDQFVKWGVKGIKVDFMQRDDQWMVNYYYKVAKEAAKRKLLVNFHGAYKPTGLYRTYPNILTSEGVRGLEHNKWSENANPRMALTIPFIRMLAGPVDYTPGAMINATKQNFRAIFNQPMSQGTRCHQLAMYVVYESPLQMLADNPSNYLKEHEAMEFLSKVPVEWDNTKVLDAKVSEFVLIARRNGSRWYIAAMTNWSERDMKIDFSFLESGEYKIDIWQDGINADRYASDYKKISGTINNKTELGIHLAPGGGWVAIVSKI